MTTESFCYWLQGYMEIQDPKTLSEKEVQIIKDHLNLVFNKVTPKREEKSPSVLLDTAIATIKQDSKCHHCGQILRTGFMCSCAFKMSPIVTC